MQNGYQGQKRNIVDDAKFETKVNEEEKRNWINLVRHKSKGMCELNKNKIKFSIRWADESYDKIMKCFRFKIFL